MLFKAVSSKPIYKINNISLVCVQCSTKILITEWKNLYAINNVKIYSSVFLMTKLVENFSLNKSNAFVECNKSFDQWEPQFFVSSSLKLN